MILVNNYSFTQDDQIDFSKVSGDWNPIHVDPVFARRTVYGQVVHGMHIVLFTLDAFLRRQDNPTPSAIYTSFISPLNLNKNISIEVSWRNDEALLNVKDEEKIITFIRLSFNTALMPTKKVNQKKINADISPKRSHERTFEDLKNINCELVLRNSTNDVFNKFQYCVRRLGLLRVAGMMGLSKFVGMEYPGLHSLFSGFELFFIQTHDEIINFKTLRYSIPLAPVRFSFLGAGMKGNLDAFLRLPPAAQDTMKNIKPLIEKNEFSNQNVLIIGGSRGLGELTAKIIASGGGKVHITYSLGELDAQNVCQEIMEESPVVCSTHQINLKENYKETLKSLIYLLHPTHIYYFASPQIKENKYSKINNQLLKEYMIFYSEAFNYLCELASKHSNIKVFYPSTVYINGNNNNFKEYCLAKLAGEKVCEFFNNKYNRKQFIYRRLPKVKTDQTQSLLQSSSILATNTLLNEIRKL